jgi:predicted nucleic acid-binding protein
MKVLVDTCVWSLALRRSSKDLNEQQRGLRDALAALIADDRVMMIGPIRQELLSGLRDAASFDRLRDRLRDFDDEPLTTEDYEAAAQDHNACRRAGVSGSAIDLLICAAARRRNAAVFTTDRDFARYASVLSVRLHRPGPARSSRLER